MVVRDIYEVILHNGERRQQSFIFYKIFIFDQFLNVRVLENSLLGFLQLMVLKDLCLQKSLIVWLLEIGIIII